ncbi:uncharacterized protein UV8b_00781 [Ustilaginoidea virens]|uniref:Uncharacterized protein n=1 Tax=Ustilaginoidea virens TaxID=1159556 RepID=A0A063BT11_USTVR|nr:uncharacterized protein UV8b_00781 [Ustilaginoidea virens]QUC16540.1 hypothetical protein UV8b_00781 [Ustilaginoidea virens]GAO16655.1 hypothetical protein UVI_02012750 [Ustilaginoidea virens]
MPPSESDILSHYLLLPAPLTAITTLDQFRTLFPRSWQPSPQIARLFRDLQAQRNQVLDNVTGNIGIEARMGAAMKREVLRAMLEEERGYFDAEIEIERALFGNASGAKSAKHTLRSVLPELQGAAGAMEVEIEKLQEEEEQLIVSITQTVDGLSDLRYGKLSNAELKSQVLEGLANLDDTCRSKT